MRLNFLGTKGTWREVANAARTTIGMEAGDKEPSSSWKKRMLLCEHSPIRKLIFQWKWYDIFWWVQTHFTRHHVGIDWWSQTSREDRTGVARDTEDSQCNPIDLEGEGNSQALINVSRRRLCSKTAEETREAWKLVLNDVAIENPEVYSVCVPDCIYRGYCYEYYPCGYYNTPSYKNRLEEYRCIK